MEGPLVSSSFIVPKTLETPRFILFPLHPDLSSLHYEAWQSSESEVSKIFGPEHLESTQICTPEENKKNLAAHFDHFVSRSAFSYCILSPDQTQCLGCVYILATESPEYQCQVYFWVRTDQKPKRLEEFVYLSIKEWLQQVWPFQFSQIAFPGREISWRDWALLSK